MNWFSLVGSIFKPAADLIDNLHTSEEEKLQAKQKMFEIQTAAFNKAEEYETKLLDAKKTIILAETQSQSVIARNWRPVTMLVFLALVVLDSLAFLPNPLAQEAWTLLQIGLGGYVAGRSAEKVTTLLKSPK